MKNQILNSQTKSPLVTLDTKYIKESHIYERLIIPFADFSLQNLEGACFMETFANYSDFSYADLYWGHIDSCNFSFATFKNADLRAGIISDTIFYHADLRGCNLGLDNLGGNTVLQNCDFTGFIYDNNTNFEGLMYDERNIFPCDFNPEEHGMLKVACTEEDDLRTIQRNSSFNVKELFQYDFCHAMLTNTSFRDLTIDNCKMSFVDFSFSSFQNSKINNTQMDHSFFWGADLRNCLLYGCDLSSAYFGNILYDKNTLFDEVVVDSRTILPKDINVKNYTIKKLNTDFEGHWEYFILPEYYSFK